MKSHLAKILMLMLQKRCTTFRKSRGKNVLLRCVREECKTLLAASRIPDFRCRQSRPFHRDLQSKPNTCSAVSFPPFGPISSRQKRR